MQAISTRPFSRALYWKRYTRRMRSGDGTSASVLFASLFPTSSLPTAAYQGNVKHSGGELGYEGDGEPGYKGRVEPGYEGNGEPGYKGNGKPVYEGNGKSWYEGNVDPGYNDEPAYEGNGEPGYESTFSLCNGVICR